MLTTLQPLFPIYALIALGAVAVRSRLFLPEGLPHLSRFTLYICIPVLVASAVSRAGSLSDFNWSFILGYAASSLIVLAGSVFLLRRHFRETASLSWILAIGASCSNSVFLGYPIASVIVPDQANALFAWCMVTENIFLLPLAVTMAGLLDGDRKADTGRVVLNTVRRVIANPTVIGLIAGLILASSGVEITGTPEKIRAMIVAAAPVLALFLIGGTVATAPISAVNSEVMFIAAAKLLVHPALTFVILSALPGVSHEEMLGGLLFAVMPMLTVFAVFATAFGGGVKAATTLVVTTLIGAVTVSATVLLFFQN